MNGVNIGIPFLLSVNNSMFDGAILRNKYNIHLYDKKNPFKYPLSYQKNCLGTQKLV